MVWRICSQARPVAKMAKVLAKGILPPRARPAAVPIRSCSATPILKNRSRKARAKTWVWVDPDRSASKTTISGFSSPNLARILPYSTLVLCLAGSFMVRLKGVASGEKSSGLQFFQGLLVFLRRGRHPMVFCLVFEDGDPFAFDSLRDDHTGPAFNEIAGSQRVHELRKTVPIHLDGMPPEGFPLLGQWFDTHDLRGATVYLQAVAIHHRGEVVQVIVG